MAHPDFKTSVSVRHLPEQSDAQSGQYAFAYTITITNSGDITAQLIARVVGHQPLLKPGESFEYTSGTRLATPHGTMRGTFFCMTEDAHPFDAPIGEFGLTLASALH